MAISGTQTFNLEVVDIIEEAYERAGLKMESSYDYRTGKRSIDLLMLEWQNRNIDIWMVDEQVWSGSGSSYLPAFSAGTTTGMDFDLALGTVDILDVSIRTGDAAVSGLFTTSFNDNRLTRLPERR